jgi:hypothetical protein
MRPIKEAGDGGRPTIFQSVHVKVTGTTRGPDVKL